MLNKDRQLESHGLESSIGLSQDMPLSRQLKELAYKAWALEAEPWLIP